jgi:hypothetical protein
VRGGVRHAEIFRESGLRPAAHQSRGRGSLSEKAGFREWLMEEVVSFSYLATYLFICFVIILYFKFALLEEQGVVFAPFGFALVKALIVAKFMLIGRSLEKRRSDRRHPLIVPTLRRAIFMTVVLVVLMAIEEVLVGLVHGRSVLTSLSELGGHTVHERIATISMQLLIMLPLFAFLELGNVVGHDRLKTAFFSLRRQAPVRRQ